MIEMSELKYQHKWDIRRHYSATVVDATSDAVRIPADNFDVLVTVVPGTSVDIQFTNDDYETIDAGTADWIDWSNGSQTAPAHATIPTGATAVRCTSTGSSKFTVTA